MLLFMFLCVTLIHCAIAADTHRFQNCKCGPNDACWPSAADWKTFNTSVADTLIADIPIAASCYPGPLQNNETCAYIDKNWVSQHFQSTNPIGLSYPDDSCLPVNVSAGEQPGSCSIGTSPRFTVNATAPNHVAAAVKFARNKNIRLVIKNTGHDILGRSTGYGSLSVWIHYLRQGIDFHESYDPGSCTDCKWKGAAFTIGGGYTFADLYPLAISKNLIVVGGGTPTVSCLGGWAQGGGHGPAVHDYGLGADQILSATVVLASGDIVTASACSHPDLFFAIRGGGGGTYGVVIQTTIKAYPNVPVVAIQQSIAAVDQSDVSAFIDAVATMYSYYPLLSDRGFSGYGSWSISAATPVIENYTGAYTGAQFTQIYAIFNHTSAEAQDLFSPLSTKLSTLNSSALYLNNGTYDFNTYWDYWDTLSNVSAPIGQAAALGSRLLDGPALTQNHEALRSTLATVAGSHDEYTSVNVIFVGGGAISSLHDPHSGVNPAWRSAYVHNIVARGWAPGTNASTQEAVHQDITNTKVAAMKKMSPRTGAYMNEADVQDPAYLEDFYGQHLWILEGIKRRYDPQDVFYCPTCVGSEWWKEDSTGKLCRAGWWH